MNPRLPVQRQPAQIAVCNTFQSLRRIRRVSVEVIRQLLINGLTKSAGNAGQMCHNTRLWRENAHFLDAAHTFIFRYFSFLFVNDKLTLCLQGSVVVYDLHTYNNHHFASGFDMSQTSTLKGQCIAEFLGTGLLIFSALGASRRSKLREPASVSGKSASSGVWGGHGYLPDRGRIRCTP